MALTQEQKDFFSANGYLSYGKVLDDSTIELLRREYDQEFEKASRDDSFRNLSVGDDASLDEKNDASVRMLQIMQMGERNLQFRKLAYHSEILDVISEFMGPNIMLFHDQALYKPAHTGGPVFWHQDNAYWKCSPANLVSCWITLDDVTAENGAMQVIPGSHLRPVWHDQSESSNALFNIEDKVDTSEAVVIDLPAGGCMFHHCQTMHYTQPNETANQRRAFALHYMPPGTRTAHTDQIMRVDFAHPLLRMNM